MSQDRKMKVTLLLLFLSSYTTSISNNLQLLVQYISKSQDRKMKVTLLLLFLSSHTTSVNALFLCSEMCITVQTSWQLSTEHAITKNNSFYFIYSQKYTKKDNQNIVNTRLCVNMMGQIKSNQNIWLNWYIQNKCQPVGTLICIMDFELSLRT